MEHSKADQSQPKKSSEPEKKQGKKQEEKKAPLQRVRLQQKPKPIDMERHRRFGVLRFSPKAWAKFNWFRDRGSTEIAGFGLSRLDDPLYVIDFVTVLQEAAAATFEFDDDALNNHLMDMVEQGWQPAECMRIWLHSHPKGWDGKPKPSPHDEEVFQRCFGKCDWSVMCILGDRNAAYGRLYISAAAGHLAMSCDLKVEIDYTGGFDGVSVEDVEAWEAEYVKNVQVLDWTRPGNALGVGHDWRSMPEHGWDMSDGDRRAEEHFEDDESGELSTLLGDEQIYRIEPDHDRVAVRTTNYWFLYEDAGELLKKEGEFVTRLSDLSKTLPVSWGELTWYDDGGGIMVSEKISVYHDGDFIQTDEDAVIATEDIT